MKPPFESRCLYPQDNGTALKLSSSARLPTLANHCFIVGEGKRADVVWSEGDFLALCEHMLNDNPPDYFLSAWIDQASGQARFAKAPRQSRAEARELGLGHHHRKSQSQDGYRLLPVEPGEGIPLGCN
jgi:hypothetical protein